MALIVETGTVVPGADSYLNVAAANLYHKAFGNAAWDDIETPDKEVLLRQATRYLTSTYRQAWKGIRVGVSQTLDWPRAEVCLDEARNGDLAGYSLNGVQALPIMVAPNVVPVEVQQACAELALRAANGELTPDQDRAVLSKTIGPITTVYDPRSPQQRAYALVESLLAPYLKARGNTMKVSR